MKAARLEDGALQIMDAPTPVPGAEEALVRISASGVCHSDLHIVRQHLVTGRSSGLGHEAIGIVESLGPGAERFAQVGDRVILGLGGMGGYWCGACEYCLRGEPRHCADAKQILGTFAEHICVWAKSLVKVHDGIGDHEAPLACGGLTAYGAVKKLSKHRVPAGRWVAVIGAAGGLGHYAVQLANLFGYRVVGEPRPRLAVEGSLPMVGRTTVVDRTTVIPSPPDVVFAAVMSPDTAPLIDPGVREWRPDAEPIGVGTHFTIRGRLGMMPIRGTSETVRWEPPLLAEFRSTVTWPAQMTAQHRFEPRADGGTNYTWSITFREVSIISRPLVALTARLFARNLANQADALTNYLRARPPPPDG